MAYEPMIPSYTYFYDVAKLAITMIKTPNVLAQEIHTVLIDLIGSRFSGKTMQSLRFWGIEFPIMCKAEDINIKVNIFRYEPKGSLETYEELLATAEDIYDLELNQKNSNITKKTLKIADTEVKAYGIMSNRKKSTPKLGLARKGAKKDIEVNIFDEITEFAEEKIVKIVNQATGGAKFNIRVKISNPWVISQWYVAQFAKALPFNEAILREKGEQFKSEFEPKITYLEENKNGVWEEKTKVFKNTLKINHITNHRINNFLSQAQHDELTNVWFTDPMLARVVDLGMPGVAEGLIYAPILHHIKEPFKNMNTKNYGGGIDWGTSTGTNGSATTMILGRKGKEFGFLAVDDEYYHSNAKQHFKDDAKLVRELVDKMINYVKENYEGIKQSEDGVLKVAYDFAADLLGNSLKTELAVRSQDSFQYVKLIEIIRCVKWDVPLRIQGVKSLIAQGRYYVNKKCIWHMQELGNSQWDETRLVNGQNTRENKEDHTLDAMEYFIGADLPKMVGEQTIRLNKQLRKLEKGV